MIRSILFTIAILACTTLAAASGRQTMVIVADRDFRTVAAWLEKNADFIEESAGAMIADSSRTQVTLTKETKHGPQTFVIRRRGHDGKYLGTFVRSIEGDVTNYACQITLQRLSPRQTEITVQMAATVEGRNSVEINVELRRSLRGIENALNKYLCRH